MEKNTKERILEEALKLFSQNGYSGTSMSDIAKQLGITKGALYKHYASKQDIFDAISEETSRQYGDFTGQLSVHMDNAGMDGAVFDEIGEDALAEKMRQVFLYSIHDEAVSRLRRMMTIEQFRCPELAQLYTERYVDRLVDYHAKLFEQLIKTGKLRSADAGTLSLQYVSPVLTLLGVCDRQPEKEAECLARLDAHVRLFFQTYTIRK